MNPKRLVQTARARVAGDEGLPAIEESLPTRHQGFAALGTSGLAKEAHAASAEHLEVNVGAGAAGKLKP